MLNSSPVVVWGLIADDMFTNILNLCCFFQPLEGFGYSHYDELPLNFIIIETAPWRSRQNISAPSKSFPQRTSHNIAAWLIE